MKSSFRKNGNENVRKVHIQRVWHGGQPGILSKLFSTAVLFLRDLQNFTGRYLQEHNLAPTALIFGLTLERLSQKSIWNEV